jgi:DNA-directed RNA polymerase subunit beta'
MVKYTNVDSVTDRTGTLVVMNRNAEISIVDQLEDGQFRERERYPLVHGAKLLKADGDTVKAGTVIAEWDPFMTPIITEVAGLIKFGDIVDGETMREQVDSTTGMSTKVIKSIKGAQDRRPRLSLKDDDGNTLERSRGGAARYQLPEGAYLAVEEGQKVLPGDVLARIPRETTKTKDITGGLPRVAELFEARRPKEFAVIAEIDGQISFGNDTKGKRKIVVTPEVGDPREYLVPKGKHILVQEGDIITAGQQLHAGSSNPHDILTVKGEKELAAYLVDEIQEIYRLQGVRINDKHIEVIVRQMLRRVRIADPGESELLAGDQIEKSRFLDVNNRMIAEGKQPARAEPLLLGITKASLATESFISAASFQETTKVLTEASVTGSVDMLRGLKENVIMGRLVPAGTGLTWHETIDVDVPGLGEQAEDDLSQALRA